MNKSELLKELRNITGASMKNCNDALIIANNNLRQAIDVLKIKGQVLLSERESKSTSEGLIAVSYINNTKAGDAAAMVEVSCETNATSNSMKFRKFADDILNHLIGNTISNTNFDINAPSIVDLRTDIIGQTKENCIIQKWFVEQVFDDNCRVFTYIHNGSKLGSIISLKAPSVDVVHNDNFTNIGMNLAMQVAATNPLAVSIERIPYNILQKQKDIFTAQLKELNKPQNQWDKIIDGKLNKWFNESCLMKQESIVVSKRSVEQLIKNEYASLLGGELEIINFVRCQVGSI